MAPQGRVLCDPSVSYHIMVHSHRGEDLHSCCTTHGNEPWVLAPARPPQLSLRCHIFMVNISHGILTTREQCWHWCHSGCHVIQGFQQKRWLVIRASHPHLYCLSGSRVMCHLLLFFSIKSHLFSICKFTHTHVFVALLGEIRCITNSRGILSPSITFRLRRGAVHCGMVHFVQSSRASAVYMADNPTLIDGKCDRQTLQIK